jgi:Flp pilus assembly protein protease CpaA
VVQEIVTLGMLDGVTLLGMAGLLLPAIFWDVTERRIPNAVVLPGAVAALLWSMTPGGLGWASALLGAGVCLGVFLLFYGARMIGAGDVKLAAALGMFHGVSGSFSLCLTILLTGGLVSLAWLAWKTHSRQGLDQPRSGQVPYALAIGLGTGIHLLMRGGAP